MLKIGIIGCGSIGNEICKAIDNKIINAELTAIFDRNTAHCDRLGNELKVRPQILSPDELIQEVDMVIESASARAVREFGLKVLKNGKDLMVLSAGAFTDMNLFNEFVAVASANNCRIYVPSGAITGIDGLRSASVSGVSEVMLTTTKNPEGLRGAPFIVKNNIDIDSFHERTLLFKGSAEEAVKAFPANVNVAATLSLAGIGAKKTKVRVYVDPGISRNIHEISVTGDFGKFSCCIENAPSPDNPRTSYLATLSAIAVLKKITGPFQIGT